MTEETATLVASLREALRGRQDVHLAILFGSRARGRARPDSDVDLAVQGENLDVLALARDLSLATRHEVDVVNLARDVGYPLLNAIARDAIFVHQGRRGAGGRWLSHTIARLETDRPWYERMRDAYLKKLARG
ncbi:MAG TPA: nucleotidyltransferase domain-containing protein [Thermoanaerobaculia bacterium]|jgi:predicted nucleotidyltransferase